MKKRIDFLYSLINKAGHEKFELHSHKGDWRERGDKKIPFLMSGLIIEVGELQKALAAGLPSYNILRECGDILNYLAMIADLKLLEEENAPCS